MPLLKSLFVTARLPFNKMLPVAVVFSEIELVPVVIAVVMSPLVVILPAELKLKLAPALDGDIIVSVPLPVLLTLTNEVLPTAAASTVPPAVPSLIVKGAVKLLPTFPCVVFRMMLAAFTEMAVLVSVMLEARAPALAVSTMELVLAAGEVLVIVPKVAPIMMGPLALKNAW